MNPLRKLYGKLCRELAQSERSAMVHSRREARRLGDTPPARALRALAAHARTMRPRFDGLVQVRQPLGALVGRYVGEMFSLLRHYLFDRMVDTERSYRGTLLGFHHGLAVARLLREVAEQMGDERMLQFCDEWLAGRQPLVEAAERELHWFAEAPAAALRSGLRAAFAPPHE